MRVGKYPQKVSTLDKEGNRQEGMVVVFCPSDYKELVAGVKEGGKELGTKLNGQPVLLTASLVIQAVREKVVRDLGIDWRSQFKPKTAGGKVVMIEETEI